MSKIPLVISQLTHPNPSDRTCLALSIARQASQQWPAYTHPDQLLIAYLIARMPFIPDCIGMSESGGYTRFVLFTCDVWQLLIYGVI